MIEMAVEVVVCRLLREALSVLARKFVTRTCFTDEVIYEKGADADAMYFVVTGQIEAVEFKEGDGGASEAPAAPKGGAADEAAAGGGGKIVAKKEAAVDDNGGEGEAKGEKN